MSTDSAANEGRATVKQVYDAVGDLRVELTGKIDDLGGKIDTVVVNHEHRLTEQATTILAVLGRLTKVEDRVDTLSTEHSIAKGHVRAITVVAGGLLTLLCGAGGLGIAHALHW